MARDPILHGLELSRQIIFDHSEMLGCSGRMPLSNQRLKVSEDPRGHHLRDNLGADPFVGKDFQQNGMGHAAIDYVRFPDAFR